MRIKQLKSIIVKKKLKVPRKNSFGTQKFRSGFFVKLTEQNGVEGYGEGFCNWPNFSAELLTSGILPTLFTIWSIVSKPEKGAPSQESLKIAKPPVFSTALTQVYKNMSA